MEKGAEKEKAGTSGAKRFAQKKVGNKCKKSGGFPPMLSNAPPPDYRTGSRIRSGPNVAPLLSQIPETLAHRPKTLKAVYRIQCV